jgi:hypothetical protein
MANTITPADVADGGNFVQIDVVDEDFDSADYLNSTVAKGQRMGVYSIEMHGDTNEYVVVKDQTDAGPIIAKLVDAGTGAIKYFDGLACCPYIDVSASSVASGNVTVFIHYRKVY